MVVLTLRREKHLPSLGLHDRQAVTGLAPPTTSYQLSGLDTHQWLGWAGWPLGLQDMNDMEKIDSIGKGGLLLGLLSARVWMSLQSC